MDQPNHQRNMINPEPIYCIVGYLITQSEGTSARNRLTNRHLNMIDGNANSYAQTVNP